MYSRYANFRIRAEKDCINPRRVPSKDLQLNRSCASPVKGHPITIDDDDLGDDGFFNQQLIIETYFFSYIYNFFYQQRGQIFVEGSNIF